MYRQTLLITLLSACFSLQAQPKYDKRKMVRERLNRGLIAIRHDSVHVALTWRTLEDDRPNEPYNIYRNGKLITQKPLTQGGTFYIDTLSFGQSATYEVKGGCCNGSYQIQAHSPVGYLPIPLNHPKGGNNDNDLRPYSYTANDASVGDVDGDGEYEIILKWDPSNSKDNSHGGYTAPTLIDCYKLSGKQLWRISLGRNIRSGAHYTPFIVYDLDGDGKAELIVKTADGTVDGEGAAIGDKHADYVTKGAAFDKRTGRILTGKEYITVFNGETGEAMDTQLYIPQRGNAADWGDDYGNRSERYLAGLAYLDGKKPYALFCRGYYTRTVITAWEWDGKRLKEHWTFDTDNPKWNGYAGQGNHNLRTADVDGDGCDEIIYGSMAVDHNGKGLYNTGMGHGDAIHLTAFYPETDELQVWDCHENRRDGSSFRDARTGKVIFQIRSNDDVGRCMAADIDPSNPGVEMWSSDSKGVWNTKGKFIASQSNAKRKQWLPINFAVWWDADLSRELLDHETISKYDYHTGKAIQLKHFDGCQFNNWTKSNPCLSGDIMGDWREEVLTRTTDSSELRLYVSTIPTPYRINCLMQDTPYRNSIAAENSGYNQPPETGFYLGTDKTDYTK